MTDSDNQPPSKRARELLAAELPAFGYAGDMAMAATNPITSPVTPTQAALRAIDAATITLLDEIKARVRGLLVDDPNWIEAGLPDAAIEAGIAAWDQAKHDMENYVSGETADWDEGMIVAAIFKAVGRATILAAIDTIQGRE